MLKKEYIAIMKDLLGADFDHYIKVLGGEPTKGVLCNHKKLSNEGLECVLHNTTKMGYGQGLYYNDDNQKYGNHAMHHAGGIYASEPSSMIVVPSVSHVLSKGAVVLDLCASPGGKSVAIANAIGDEGLLISNEIVPTRAKILQSNIERMGFTNTVVTSTDAKTLCGHFESTFDMVFVDAPCSGEGMFRKDEQALVLWSIEEVKSNAVKQLGILEDICDSVKGNGYLVYSTCTFNMYEDDGVVEEFLSRHPEFERVDIDKSCTPYLTKSKYGYRFFPHVAKGEGQFVTLLHKKEGEQKALPLAKQKEDKDIQLTKKFLQDNFVIPFPLYFCKVGSRVNVMTRPCVDVSRCHALTCGVQVGEVVKDRVEPHHQLFSAYGAYAKTKYDLDDQEVYKYLKGEELTANLPNGYACVTYKDCPLGAVKIVNGTLKNKYPKGLRMN